MQFLVSFPMYRRGFCRQNISSQIWGEKFGLIIDIVNVGHIT